MSNERDELAELLANTEYPRLSPVWKDRADRSPVKYYSRKTADAILAAGYRKVSPDFANTLRNDGTYEFTVTSDCNGSNVRNWRRIPGLTYAAQPHQWEQVEA